MPQSETFHMKPQHVLLLCYWFAHLCHTVQCTHTCCVSQRGARAPILLPTHSILSPLQQWQRVEILAAFECLKVQQSDAHLTSFVA